MVPTSDAELMTRAAAGDMEPFAELVARYEGKLLHFFSRFVDDRSEAEDCAQEVFIKLFRSRERYTASASFRTFLYTIAMNYWIDVYRQKKCRPIERSLDAPAASWGEGPSLGELVPDAGPSPSQELSATELSEQLYRAVQGLSEEHRSVWVLAEEQGLRYAEVSSILGIPVGTVKSRMHAATHRLRDMIRRESQRWER